MFEGARNDADLRLRPTCVYRDPSARRDVPVSLPKGVAASPFSDPGRCAEGEAANPRVLETRPLDSVAATS